MKRTRWEVIKDRNSTLTELITAFDLSAETRRRLGDLVKLGVAQFKKLLKEVKDE